MVFAIILSLTVDLFKSDEIGLSKIIINSVGVLFSTLLIVVVFLTWGIFHSHSEIRITKSGILKTMRLPPFVAKKHLISAKSIKSISNKENNKLVFDAESLLFNESQYSKLTSNKLEMKLKNGNSEIIETQNPRGFIRAVKKMFSEGRS